MSNFAVINNGVVENCIVADSLAIAEEVTGLTCIEYTSSTEVSIGYLYDNETFTNPNPPVEEVSTSTPEVVPDRIGI